MAEAVTYCFIWLVTEMLASLSEILIRDKFLEKYPYTFWFGAARGLPIARYLPLFSIIMYFRLQFVQYVSWRTQMPLRWTHEPLPPAFRPPQ